MISFLFTLNIILITFILKQSFFILHVPPYAGAIGIIIHSLIASLIQRKTGDSFAICVLRLFEGDEHKIKPKPDTRKYPRYVIAIMLIMNEFALLTAIKNMYLFAVGRDMEVSQSLLDSNFNRNVSNKIVCYIYNLFF